jgi:hypothetical protein
MLVVATGLFRNVPSIHSIRAPPTCTQLSFCIASLRFGNKFHANTRGSGLQNSHLISFEGVLSENADRAGLG